MAHDSKDGNKRLTWRGNRTCRSLMVRGVGGAPIFYLEGDYIPAGLISAELEDAMVEDGRIDRVVEIYDRAVSRSIAIEEIPIPQVLAEMDPEPEPIPGPPESTPLEPEPISLGDDAEILVPVGCMDALVHPGPDGEFGTGDDDITIRPTYRDERPDTAPVRRRGRPKKVKK